jgi:histidinol-phosphate aminotransferase/imidazoleglycerol-phosphate dehydratase/histidinol-phosphatase
MTMDWLTPLIRPELFSLAAYRSARTEAGDFTPAIGIDANEFPWPAFGAIASHCAVNRYPEAQPTALKQRLAAIWSLAVDQLLLTRGSDEGIDLLLRLLCRAGLDQILVCPPTYGMYQVAAAVQGAAVLSVPLTADWQLDVAGILAACTPHTKLIFIPSPNAPMGHLMEPAALLELCRARAGQSLIVVDEAYVEFTDQPQGMLPHLAAHPNMVILRTLSKAHALAGERVGAVIGHPDLLAQLQKILAPYPLSQSSIRAALDALSPNGLIQNAQRRRLLVAERERMAGLLLQSPMVRHVFPSVGNFLLLQTTDAAAVMDRLRTHDILARSRHSNIANTVRLSIGTPGENDLVLQALGITLPPAALPRNQRLFSHQRVTRETAIAVTVDLDHPSFFKVDTGIGFFDHMLAQISSHGGFGLEMHCQGDLQIDQHHSIEDCALALGAALKGALGDKRGVNRFGFHAPLDEAVAEVVVDLSGRPYCVFTGELPAEKVGEMSSEMVPHFFHSLATAMAASIHVTVRGQNTHHMVEAAFKAMGRALRQAFQIEGGASSSIPSTKGVL